MNALELAEWLEDLFPSDGEPEQAAALLRRQHEAIVKLREALGFMLFSSHYSADEMAKQALKDTEDLK